MVPNVFRKAGPDDVSAVPGASQHAHPGPPLAHPGRVDGHRLDGRGRAGAAPGRLGDPGGGRRAGELPGREQLAGLRDRAGPHGVHPGDAARVRRRPHRGHRQHHPQADGGGQEARHRRLLVLARPLEHRVRAVPAARPRRALARRAAGERRLDAAERRRRVRHAGLGDVPLHPRDPEPRDPGRHRQGLPRHAARRVRRGRARGAAEQPRLHEPVPRRPDQVGHEAVADLPHRAAVRARLRHRHRDRPAGARRWRGRVPAAVVRHPHAAGAVRGRDEPARLDRRLSS